MLREWNRRRIEKRRYKQKAFGKCKWFNRQKGEKKLCVILAGYKSFLYDTVFNRIERYIPSDIDVCIVSSGIFDKKLYEIAEKNHWSYLSTERNNVSLVQNMAIRLHPNAEFIYKIDEDIFMTKNSFEKLMDTYNKAVSDRRYYVGFVAPLIPINGYGHVRILEKLHKEGEYIDRFGEITYAGFGRFPRPIDQNPDTAKFFWGGSNHIIPSIDQMNREFQRDTLRYTTCPIRFNIGCILFTRDLWNNMGMYSVPSKGAGMGADEEQICEYCLNTSQAIIVSENVVVGHLSFSAQNYEMKKYYENHKDEFMGDER